jgi:hypothetical protein
MKTFKKTGLLLAATILMLAASAQTATQPNKKPDNTGATKARNKGNHTSNGTTKSTSADATKNNGSKGSSGAKGTK